VDRGEVVVDIHAAPTLRVGEDRNIGHEAIAKVIG
jgi:hypothetical protein